MLEAKVEENLYRALDCSLGRGPNFPSWGTAIPSQLVRPLPRPNLHLRHAAPPSPPRRARSERIRNRHFQRMLEREIRALVAKPGRGKLSLDTQLVNGPAAKEPSKEILAGIGGTNVGTSNFPAMRGSIGRQVPAGVLREIAL